MPSEKLGFSSRKSLRYRGTECLNCGQPLDKSDVYCPHCSQINSNKQLSVRDFLSEFLGSILVYDSRLRHTLRDLFRPGRITKNYVAGKRLKYANPFRFFLSVSIIYFLIKGIFGVVDPTERKSFREMTGDPNGQKEISTEDASMPPDLFISELKGDSVMAKKLNIKHYYSEELLDSKPYFTDLAERGALYLEYHYKYPEMGSEDALQNLQHKNSFKNRWLFLRMVAFKKIMDDPRAFVEYFIAKMPFFLFFFTPFFALSFWMIYSKKKYNYMEHMIFIFHIFSFIFLLKLLVSIPELIFNIDILGWPLVFFIGTIYFYFALKNFYQQTHLMTFIKFVILGFIFNTSFMIALFVFVTGTAAIY